METSDKKNAGNTNKLSQEHPLASRKTLYSLNHRMGKIIALDATNFGIDIGDTVLLPVNLPEQFKKAGVSINFSGAVKEIEPTEFWAATPVLLTMAETGK